MGNIGVKVNEAGRDVIVYRHKDSRNAIVKTLRAFKESFKMSQFDCSLEMLNQFYELVNVSISFIHEFGLDETYLGFIKQQAKEFNYLIKNFLSFQKEYKKQLSSKSPIF